MSHAIHFRGNLNGFIAALFEQVATDMDTAERFAGRWGGERGRRQFDALPRCRQVQIRAAANDVMESLRDIETFLESSWGQDLALEIADQPQFAIETLAARSVTVTGRVRAEIGSICVFVKASARGEQIIH